MSKKITSFTKLVTPEGVRLTCTYSKIDDETGTIISMNEKFNMVIADETILSCIDQIDNFLIEKTPV